MLGLGGDYICWFCAIVVNCQIGPVFGVDRDDMSSEVSSSFSPVDGDILYEDPACCDS